jgi:hypothetical protein
MKKLILSLLAVAALCCLHVALVANAAPTSTVVQNLKITALGDTGTPCLVISNIGGLVATSTCAAGGGGGVGTSTPTVGFAYFVNANTISGTSSYVASFNGATGTVTYSSTPTSTINGFTGTVFDILAGNCLTRNITNGSTTLALSATCGIGTTTVGTAGQYAVWSGANTLYSTSSNPAITAFSPLSISPTGTILFTNPGYVTVSGFTDATTSTSANTFTVSTSTTKITITIPPRGDQYFAPSSTICTNCISTSTWVVNASGSNFLTNNWGGSSTAWVSPFLTLSTLSTGNASETSNLTVAGYLQAIGALVDANGNAYVTSTTAGSGTVTTSSPVTTFNYPYWTGDGKLNGTSSLFFASSTGNIGIGTTTPGDILTLQAGAAASQIQIANNGSLGLIGFPGSGSQSFTIDPKASGLSFRAGNGSRLLIGSDGTFQLGSTPGGTTIGKFNFNGNPVRNATSGFMILGSNFLWGGTNGSGTWLGINTTSTENANFIDFENNSTTKFKVASSGAVTAQSIGLTDTSSTNLTVSGYAQIVSLVDASGIAYVTSTTAGAGTVTTSSPWSFSPTALVFAVSQSGISASATAAIMLPNGAISSSQMYVASATIGILLDATGNKYVTSTSAGGGATGVVTGTPIFSEGIPFFIFGGSSSTIITNSGFTFGSSTGILSVGSSSLTNVSSTKIDVSNYIRIGSVNVVTSTVTSALRLAGSAGQDTAYGGAAACSGTGGVTTISATGATTCATFLTTQALPSSTIWLTGQLLFGQLGGTATTSQSLKLTTSSLVFLAPSGTFSGGVSVGTTTLPVDAMFYVATSSITQPIISASSTGRVEIPWLVDINNTKYSTSSVTNALLLGAAGPSITAYGGASACAGTGAVTTISAVGGTTCATFLTTEALPSSTIWLDTQLLFGQAAKTATSSASLSFTTSSAVLAAPSGTFSGNLSVGTTNFGTSTLYVNGTSAITGNAAFGSSTIPAGTNEFHNYGTGTSTVMIGATSTASGLTRTGCLALVPSASGATSTVYYLSVSATGTLQLSSTCL